jgi:hypothetical protein
MALQKANALGAGEIKAFEPSALEVGKGFYGKLVRLTLQYDPPETSGPRTLIAKFSSDNPEMRERPNTKASYEREIHFYQEIASGSPIPVPTCYYGRVDMASGWHVLLLEDLAPARSGSRLDGCSQTEAGAAIAHIARFHAHWWENPALGNLNWLADRPGAPSDAQVAERHEEWWPAFLLEVEYQLPDAVMEIGQRLGEQRGRIARHLFAGRPRTLIHSDYHLDNLLFGEDGTSLFVVDWQFVKHGRGIWDVAYFLSQNLAPADRQAIEMDLLSDYIAILNHHGVQTYSLGDAIRDYRLSFLHRLGALISTIAAMPFTREQIRFHTDVLLPRIVAAILHHDCRSLLGSTN